MVDLLKIKVYLYGCFYGKVLGLRCGCLGGGNFEIFGSFCV